MDILQSFAQIGFDWRIALANLVNFLIVFFVLKYFVFQPVKEILTKRRAKIQQGLEDAQKAESKRVMAEEKYKEKVSAAKDEANQIIASAREQKKDIIENAREEAHQEADQIMKDARERIEKERNEMEAELREHTAELVVDGIEKILGEEIGPEKEEEIIHRMVKRV